MTPASSQRAATPRPVRAGGPPARSHVPSAPRRVSGPVKRPQSRPPTRRPSAPRQEPLRTRAAAALFAFIRSLPDSRWLDRLVRGRAWIPAMGVLLAGIIATQVEVLKLGASTGRWMSRTAALTSRNQALQVSVASLSNEQRIQRLAGQMGMVMAAPTDVNFVALHPAGGLKAAMGRIHAPDAAAFLAALSASEATAEAEAAPTVPATPSSPSTTPTSQGSGATATGPSTTALPTTTSTAPTTTTAPTGPPAGGPTTESTGGVSAPSGTAPQTGG